MRPVHTVRKIPGCFRNRNRRFLHKIRLSDFTDLSIRDANNPDASRSARGNDFRNRRHHEQNRPNAAEPRPKARNTRKTAFLPVCLSRIQRIPQFRSSRQLLAGCGQSGLMQGRETTPFGNLCGYSVSAVFLALGIDCGSAAPKPPGEGRRTGGSASRFGELVLKLAMQIAAMLVLLHGPEEQRLAAALFLPSFPDVLLLLLVLNQMLAFIHREPE